MTLPTYVDTGFTTMACSQSGNIGTSFTVMKRADLTWTTDAEYTHIGSYVHQVRGYVHANALGGGIVLRVERYQGGAWSSVGNDLTITSQPYFFVQGLGLYEGDKYRFSIKSSVGTNLANNVSIEFRPDNQALISN